MARWTKDELLLVLDLYFRTPFGKQHKGYQPIIDLASRIGRTPSAVAMKLCNFTSLDASERARGIHGLANASQLDIELWDEYLAAPDEVAMQIEDLVEKPDKAANDSILETETEGVRRIRKQQNFFRRIVLGTYGKRCCITGLPIPELLRASHIVPWSHSQKERLNPRNGLCLAATFDAAFDRGLIWFDVDYRLRLTQRLLEYASNEETERVFLSREGIQLKLPEKNLPDPDFLKFHRDNVAQQN